MLAPVVYHLPMRLLERDGPMRELERVWAEAARGQGRLALISGEAGVGKSSLVRRFAQDHPAVSLLWGGCDALFTPRPLGPLYDMAGASARLDGLLRDGAPAAAVFSGFVDELRARPTLVVFEDVHWADEATLDLLRYTGRRIDATRALLIITYRDDEIGPSHPLRAVLGDLIAPDTIHRVPLQPLSAAAVRRLVGDRPVDAAALHRRTGGNPFFVTEVLAAVEGLPPTVRDAVLARAARLSPVARSLLDVVAVAGPRADLALLEDTGASLTGDPAQVLAGLEEASASGVLVANGDQITFRHELARQAILEAASPIRRAEIHRLVLAALVDSPEAEANPARLVHHAEAAADREAILRFAPPAGRQAAAANAHRAAANHFELALRHAAELPPREQAALLEAYAHECNLVDRRAEGAEACRRAAALWAELGEPVRQGNVLAVLANMLIGVGRNAEAATHLEAAIALLEANPPGPELASAYRMAAGLTFIDQDYDRCMEWSRRSIELAELLGDTAAALSSHNLIGSALPYSNYDEGRAYLERNRAAAEALGALSVAGHALTNLASASCELYHLREAEAYLREGIAYAAEHDLDRYRLYMTSWQAINDLRRGQWDGVAETALSVLDLPGVSVPSRITALVALGLWRARTGQPGAEEALDEALELTRQLTSLHRVGLVRAARAEAAWLAGDAGRAAQEAARVYDLAVRVRHPWFAGELAAWLWRGGRAPDPPAWLAEPYRRLLAGDARGAAATWEALGAPYDAALALPAGDETDQREALSRLEALGARPAADALRDRLRRAGVTRIPRGPRPTTRDNPLGLTERQAEVVALLAEGLTNSEIAARLQLSPKTVGHHVSAIFDKLDVHSREEAAAAARDAGLL